MKKEFCLQIGSRRFALLPLFLILTCALTVLSQHPFLVEAGATQYVAYPCWAVLAVLLILDHKPSLDRRFLHFCKYPAMFLLLMVLQTVITKQDYFKSSMVYSYFLAMAVFAVGYFISHRIGQKELNAMAWAYVVPATLLAIWIYFAYFFGKSVFHSGVPAYTSKNSYAQILLTAIVLLLFIVKPRSRWGQAMKYGVLLLQSIFLFMLRSRATMVGFCLVVVLLLLVPRALPFLGNTRRFVIAVLAIFALMLLFNGAFREFFVERILFAGRDAGSINAISSGRLSLMRRLLPTLRENLLWGIGSYYIDCFPFAAVLQFGIPGAIALIVTAVYPLCCYRRCNALGADWQMALIALSLAYLSNGLFECLAPFGPGVKCFFLWLLFGILMGKAGERHGLCEKEASIP